MIFTAHTFSIHVGLYKPEANVQYQKVWISKQWTEI